MIGSSTSTSAFFDGAVSQIQSLRQQADALQQQLSSGNKLPDGSSDPVAASRLRLLSRADTLGKIDTTASNRANSDLRLADEGLQSFADAITQAQQLATQAASSVLNTSQRASIGTQLQQLFGQMVQLANTRDSVGHSLFGGETSGQAYTLNAAGQAVYSGTGPATQVDLGEGQTVTATLTGPEFLDFQVNGAPANLLETVRQLASDLQGGSPNPQAAAQGALDSLSAGLDAVATAQTVIGARQAFVELNTNHRATVTDLRTSEQADLGGTDIATTIASLQQTMLVLQASQSSFARLSQLSLFSVLN